MGRSQRRRGLSASLSPDELSVSTTELGVGNVSAPNEEGGERQGVWGDKNGFDEPFSTGCAISKSMVSQRKNESDEKLTW